ncbi:hypothetical protein ACJX0J_032473, partial [Zea mays]
MAWHGMYTPAASIYIRVGGLFRRSLAFRDEILSQPTRTVFAHCLQSPPQELLKVYMGFSWELCCCCCFLFWLSLLISMLLGHESNFLLLRKVKNWVADLRSVRDEEELTHEEQIDIYTL